MTAPSANGGAHHDDDDLEDLLEKKKDSPQINGSGYKRPVPSYGQILIKSLQYQVHSCCFLYPVTCGIIMIGMMAAILWLLFAFILNPTQEFGVIKHDHSNIKSKLDFATQKVDHWCLGGGDESCTCEDPLVPLSRYDHKSWVVAFKSNRKKIDDSLEKGKTVDVAFLGESIVEEMDGRWLGQFGRTQGMNRIGWNFRSHFDKDYGGTMEGIALGIAGDTSSNVLWRLMHGELPDAFKPKVWWLFLGMDDLARTKCSEEVVVLGILRVVEEIMEKRPGVKIVINSLLPMTAFRGESYPTISDINESFSNKQDREKPNNRTRQLELEDHHIRLLKDDKESDAKKGKDDTKKEDDKKKEDKNDEDKKLETEAEAEEVARDKKVKKKQPKKQQKVKDADLVLKDKKRVKKFKVGHIRQNKVPLWTSIKSINAVLKRFVDLHSDQVSYFDATKLFVITDTDSKKSTLRGDLATPRGMLTAKGYEVLTAEMVTKLQEILNDIRYPDSEVQVGHIDDDVDHAEEIDYENEDAIDDETRDSFDDFFPSKSMLDTDIDDLFEDLEYGDFSDDLVYPGNEALYGEPQSQAIEVTSANDDGGD